MKQQIIELLEEILTVLGKTTDEINTQGEDLGPDYYPTIGPRSTAFDLLQYAIRWQIFELKSDEIHSKGFIQEVGEALNNREITKEEVEEVRHLSKLQEQAEELPYAVRNLNLPDEPPCTTQEIIEDIFAGERTLEDVIDDYVRLKRGVSMGLEEKRHLIELNEHKNFARQDLEDEETDRLAREEVERSLYAAGIIEDPDCDGGLNG